MLLLIMKNNNKFFLGLTASIIFAISSILMLFTDFIIIGAVLFIAGFFLATFSLSKTFTRGFKDSFLFVATVLSLVILAYTFFVDYSKNIIIISTSFYALNFLIQTSNVRRKKASKLSSKKSMAKKSSKNITGNVDDVKSKPQSVKSAVAELKQEIRANKSVAKDNYYYVEKGTSFHKSGCIALARSSKGKLKVSHSRDDLISKGYKTCKLCNS